jgi:hypothetical protein
MPQTDYNLINQGRTWTENRQTIQQSEVLFITISETLEAGMKEIDHDLHVLSISSLISILHTYKAKKTWANAGYNAAIYLELELSG